MAHRRNPVWRLVLAFILDFSLVFGFGGYLIARLTGDTTENGFALNGVPAIGLLVLILAYFFGMNRLAGGTIFRRILGVPPRYR